MNKRSPGFQDPELRNRETYWLVDVIFRVIEDPREQVLVGDWDVAGNSKGHVQSDKCKEITRTIASTGKSAQKWPDCSSSRVEEELGTLS
jgi:hypothetical protein